MVRSVRIFYYTRKVFSSMDSFDYCCILSQQVRFIRGAVDLYNINNSIIFNNLISAIILISYATYKAYNRLY